MSRADWPVWKREAFSQFLALRQTDPTEYARLAAREPRGEPCRRHGARGHGHSCETTLRAQIEAANGY